MPLNFHSVVILPLNFKVFDFTQGPDPRAKTGAWGVGKYGEKRKNTYSADLFLAQNGEVRDVHLGIDISAPVGTPVFAFADGEIFMKANNNAAGDYGWTLITKHKVVEIFEGSEFFVLWGHLDKNSVVDREPGQRFVKGEKLARMGGESDNGGWPPHLHFQITLVEPKKCDLPGVTTSRESAEAFKIYPDPRIVLGPLY